VNAWAPQRATAVISPDLLRLPSTFMLAASRGRYGAPRHIIALERFVLDAIADGDQLLTVELPVRTGKSTYVDHYLPAWFLGTFPYKHVGLASHEAQFASSWGQRARDTLIEFGPSFGVEVSRDIRSRAWWEIEEHAGSMRSFGIAGGGITGRGFDLLILDDLIKNAADADSEVHREAQWNFLTGTAMSRLEPGATMIVMMARWHEDDLIGRIHQEMPGQWRRLRLPAIAEEPDEEHPEPDAMGRAPGEALWPARYPLSRLRKRRERSGEYYFNANYQQRPSSPQGTIFKRAWWQRWRALPEAFDLEVWSWDMAFKDKESSSFVVGQCWGQRGADYFLRYQVRGQWSYSATKAMLVHSIKLPQYNGARSTVLIEDKANGTAIMDDLRHEVGGLIPVSVGQDSKVARARSITGYVESGNVYLPEAGTEASFDDDGANWVAGFINEHASFPKGAHDDQVDATSQALREMLERYGGGTVVLQSGDLPPRG
jgi:predicted phage terminase large subunit-like protein